MENVKLLVQTHLQWALEIAESVTEWKYDVLQKKYLDFCEKNWVEKSHLLHPLRVALTGQEKSPSAFLIMEAIGKEKSIQRIKEAIEKSNELSN